MKESFKNKLANCTWAGYVENVGDEKLANGADAQKKEWKWRRGRPQLR